MATTRTTSNQLQAQHIQLCITPATQYATAWAHGKPVATAVRRKVYAQGPAWQVFGLQGNLLFATNFNPAMQLRRLARHLNANAQ